MTYDEPGEENLEEGFSCSVTAFGVMRQDDPEPALKGSDELAGEAIPRLPEIFRGGLLRLGGVG